MVGLKWRMCGVFEMLIWSGLVDEDSFEVGETKMEGRIGVVKS